jgi:hypothetical protein
MSRDVKTEEWIRDFESFLKQDEIASPQTIRQSVLKRVYSDLNPSFQRVGAKLFGLHALAAGIVSLFCPQLGVGPIIGEHGIMQLFMRFGPLPCAALCGAVFMGTSALFATLFLAREELKLANNYSFINATFLAAVSFAGLMLAGGQSDRLSYVFWIVGAVFAGWVTLKLGSSFRLRTQSYKLSAG